MAPINHKSRQKFVDLLGKFHKKSNIFITGSPFTFLKRCHPLQILDFMTDILTVENNQACLKPYKIQNYQYRLLTPPKVFCKIRFFVPNSQMFGFNFVKMLS